MSRQLTQLVSLVVIASSLVFAGASDIEFEGLEPRYQKIADVRIKLRNTTSVPLNLDSFQVDMIVVERRAEDGTSWESGYGFRCTNAGAGTPRAIKPGDALDMWPLAEHWAFHLDEEPPWFETADGGRRPITGRYRLLVRYSCEPWSTIAEIPDSSEIRTAVSREFEVGDGR